MAKRRGRAASSPVATIGAVWESVFFIKKAIEKSGWKTKKDTPEFIKALEGMKVEEFFLPSIRKGQSTSVRRTTKR